MMEFHFDCFFGLKKIDTGIVFFVPFIGIIILSILIALLSSVFRRLKCKMYFFHSLLYGLVFTFVLGSPIMLVLLFITDRNGVKLAYCWLTFFVGMEIFAFINNNQITKFFTDWSKMLNIKGNKKNN